jgi:hypothetical protein
MFPMFLMGISMIVFGVAHRSTEAQSTALKISSISVNAWTSKTATIAYTVSGVRSGDRVEVQVQYGTSTQYGSTYPTTTFASTQATDSVTLTDLEPSTTYHYRLRIRSTTATTILDTSADRTFSTKSSDAAAAPVIIVEGTDCTNVSCLISFKTSIPSRVTIGWDTSFKSPANESDFCTAYSHCVSENAGSYLSTSRQLQLTGLTAGTYHYRLMASAQNGSWAMTGSTIADLEVTTSSSGSDHTFTTGSCSEGGTSFPIGTCLPSGLICTPSGAKEDCRASCGFTCGSGRTCNASGTCEVDPTLNGSPTQCNQVSCYNADGSFKNPAGAGCFASWPKCTANTILKVQRDRGCNVWLSCGTSVQTTPAKNQPAENLCLSLSACNQIGPDGQCLHYLPQGQCDNDPMRFCSNDSDCTAGGTCNASTSSDPTKNLQDVTYTSPSNVEQISHLSGNVIAGLDWTKIGGQTVIQGALPWQMMRQIGGSVALKNGDFETNAPSTGPWVGVPLSEVPDDMLQVDFEDRDSSINHVLKVTPITQRVVTDDTVTPPTESVVEVNFPGAASQTFPAVASEYYYAEARIRAPNGNPVVRFEFGHKDFTQFTVSSNGQTLPAYTDIQAGAVWQHVTIGPIKGLSGTTRVAIVCADPAACSEFWVDDVQVKPILQVNTNPNFVTPSCRLYPKENSPACDYTDENGVAFKGWRGYCLESDSQTGNCLSWWPVDIIKGESSIFGTDKVVGYQDRAPLYYCAESTGSNLGTTNGVQKAMTTVVSLDTVSPRTHACANPDGSLYTATSGNITLGTKSCTSDSDCTGLPTGDGTCKTIGRCESFSPIRSQCVSDADCPGLSPQCSFTGTGGGYHGGEAGIHGASENFFPSTQGATPPFDVNSEDRKINEKDIDNIFLKVVDTFGMANEAPMPNVYLTKDSTYAAGCQGHYVNKPWSYCWEDLSGGGAGPDFFTVHFEFDADGYLKQVQAQGWDGSSYDGGVYVLPMFTMKEKCTKLVQVVDASGQTLPFTQRVNSRTTVVSDLNYTRSSDLTPFGAALTPDDPTNDPTHWTEPLYVSKLNPTIDAPGQVRAGLPYASVNDSGEALCSVEPTNNTPNQCNAATATKNCYTSVDENGGATGSCIGAYTTSASNRGNQIFNAAQNGLTTGVAGADQLFAQNRLQRLFAQSLGVWTTLRCSNNSAVACLQNSDCGAGTCSVQTVKYALMPNSTIGSATSSNFVGWTPPSTLCPETQVTTPGSCSTQQLACDVDKVLVSDPARTIAQSKDAGTQKCKTLVACDGSSASCTKQNVRGTSVKFTEFISSTCAQSGKDASGNALYTCNGKCVVASGTKYTAVKQAESVLPPVTQQVRPAAPNDYCAIPPSVTTMKFSNSSSLATVVRGGGNIAISFNSNADADQVPMSQIVIDWGDGRDTYAYPYAPKNDPRTPHIFSHVYNFNKADNDHCSTGSCVYEIKIQLKDNWGWCSEAGVKWCSNSNTQCTTSAECGGGASCDYKRDTNGNVVQCQNASTYWATSGLKVIVNP